MLLVDIGNTCIKYTYVKENLFTSHDSITHQELNESWMNKCWGKPDAIYVASVAHPELITSIKRWADSIKIPCFVINSEARFAGVSNAYDKPESLGVDRWLALLGAKKCFPSENIMVVDVGTATTIDMLTADGIHQGGWIFPGLDLLVNSVVDNTIQVEGKAIGSALAFGKNTSECLSFSAIAGTIGLIEKAIMLVNENKAAYRIVMLGGNAEIIAQNMQVEIAIEKDLIFHGLLEYSKEYR